MITLYINSLFTSTNTCEYIIQNDREIWKILLDFCHKAELEYNNVNFLYKNTIICDMWKTLNLQKNDIIYVVKKDLVIYKDP